MRTLKVVAMLFATCIVAELSLFGMAHMRVNPIVGALTYALAVRWDIERGA